LRLQTVSAVLVVLSLLTPAALAQSSSASYVLKQSTTNGGGETTTSTSYRLTASAGQESTIGTSSSPAYVLQSGFWSYLGSGLVPVILMVHKNGITPGNVDLTWSGNNSPYDIFEATDCTNVYAAYYDMTPSNSYPDITPPVADLTCYSVLATAPGPAPPPGAP
jgi:hypothetical protein